MNDASNPVKKKNCLYSQIFIASSLKLFTIHISILIRIDLNLSFFLHSLCLCHHLFFSFFSFPSSIPFSLPSLPLFISISYVHTLVLSLTERSNECNTGNNQCQTVPILGIGIFIYYSLKKEVHRNSHTHA